MLADEPNSFLFEQLLVTHFRYIFRLRHMANKPSGFIVTEM